MFDLQTYHFVHVSPTDGSEIAQDITFDKGANTVMVVVGDTSKYKDYISTINFHDFNTVSMLYEHGFDIPSLYHWTMHFETML